MIDDVVIDVGVINGPVQVESEISIDLQSGMLGNT